MISARRAREGDLDKGFSRKFEAGGNLSALPATFQSGVGPSTAAACAGTTFGKAGCTIRRFRARESATVCGETKNDHRAAHLEHAERPQDLGRAGGNGAALQ